MELGTVIKQLRFSASMTQEQLAEKLGMFLGIRRISETRLGKHRG